MTNITSVQAQGASPERAETAWAVRAGIQFGEDELTPEEQQLEITKREIWKKLMSRLQIKPPRMLH